MKGKVILFSGPAGVGKTTTATYLANKLEKSAYISGDTVSNMPISGYKKPWECNDAKNLVFENIKSLSLNFLNEGYDVVSDWIIMWEDISEHAMFWIDKGYEVIYVVLWTDEDVNVKRDASRDIDVQMGERVKILRNEFRESNIANKYYLDNTNLELEEVASKILLDNKYLVNRCDIEIST